MVSAIKDEFGDLECAMKIACWYADKYPSRAGALRLSLA